MTGQNFSALLLNLDRDTARLSHMEKQLAQAGISFTRQPGVLGESMPEDLRGFFYDDNGHPKTTMKRGEIGCYASHLLALRQVAAGALGDVALIMEDDLDLAPDLIKIIADARRKAAPEWDIIRLSSRARRAYAPVARIGQDRFLVRYSKIPMGAGAYLITPAGAEKFLRQGVRGLTFDDDLRRPWFHHMDTYGILPPPVKAGVLSSTIDSLEAGRFNKGISSRQERILRGDFLYISKRIAYNVRNMGFVRWALCDVINLIDMLMKPLLRRSIIDRAARLFLMGRQDVR